MTTVQSKLAPRYGQALIIVAASAIGLAGCAGFKESIGAAKQSPDETAITTRAPLVVPATFDLKAPTPGAPRPQDADTAAQAQRVLGGPSIKMAPASDGEKALLTASGASSTDPKVRQELRTEVLDAKKRKSYADAVLFWRGTKGDPGQPLDPNEEEARLNASKPAVVEKPVVIEKAPDSTTPVPVDKKEEKKDDSSSGGWFDWF